MRTAHRVTLKQARAHFNKGGSVLVSEHGHEETRNVGPSTTVHSRDSITWLQLTDMVKTWANRYPHQRFYIVSDNS